MIDLTWRSWSLEKLEEGPTWVLMGVKPSPTQVHSIVIVDFRIEDKKDFGNTANSNIILD